MSSHIPARRKEVTFLAARRLQLVASPTPTIPTDHQHEIDQRWKRAVANNPALFDGPVVACREIDATDAQILQVHWTTVTYRHIADIASAQLSGLTAMFVAVVQPTPEGILTGRMSANTGTPGRWQLPGGAIDPPDPSETFDEATLAQNATRELREETGIHTSPGTLTFCHVTQDEDGTLGIFFLAPPQPTTTVRDLFARRSNREDPEVREITFVQTLHQLTELLPQASYLPGLVERMSRR